MVGRKCAWADLLERKAAVDSDLGKEAVVEVEQPVSRPPETQCPTAIELGETQVADENPNLVSIGGLDANGRQTTSQGCGALERIAVAGSMKSQLKAVVEEVL